MPVNFNFILFLAQLCVVCLCTGENTWSSLGYEYYTQIHGWLKLHPDPVDWLAARTNCHLEGGYLVSPWTNQFTETVIALQLSYKQYNNDDEIPLYSGVQITKTSYIEGLYSYVEDQPAVLLNPWHAQQDLCGVFSTNGSWAEVDCNQKLAYVCYAPAAVPTPEAVSIRAPKPICGNTSLGYELSQQTGHCYKFHDQVANWTEANRTCVAEGARLAVPNSVEEMMFLTSLHARYPDKEINGTAYPDWVSVGIYWETVSSWTTVDGQSLAESGYTKWMEGWPGNDKNYPYVCMQRNGEYSTTYSVLYPFICEMVPQRYEGVFKRF